MYRNKVEETTVSTGDVIALDAATTGNKRANVDFTIGELFSYLITDDNGDEYSGLGKYTAANQLTRNDTKTVISNVVDDAPSSNPALAAGTSTVTCAKLDSDMNPTMVNMSNASTGNKFIIDSYSIGGSSNVTLIADRIYLRAYCIAGKATISALGAEITSLAATLGDVRLGLYRMLSDGSFALVDTTGIIDASTATGSTGYVQSNLLGGAISIRPSDIYYITILSDGDPEVRGVNNLVGGHPYMPQREALRGWGVYVSGVASAALPATISKPDHNNTVTSGTYPTVHGVE